MKSVYIWLALILLLLSSAGGFYAGYNLLIQPDGSTIQQPLVLLQHTPFNNFYIPAILLIITVGILGVLSIIVTIFQVSYHAKFTIAAGLILTVWMFVYMVLAPEIYRTQYVVLAMGLGELLCGLALDRKENLEGQL
jgi:hypothetical protein